MICDTFRCARRDAHEPGAGCVVNTDPRLDRPGSGGIQAARTILAHQYGWPQARKRGDEGIG